VTDGHSSPRGCHGGPQGGSRDRRPDPHRLRGDDDGMGSRPGTTGLAAPVPRRRTRPEGAHQRGPDAGRAPRWTSGHHVGPPPTRTDEHIEVLGAEEIVVVASPEHRFSGMGAVPLAELSAEPLVHYDRDNGNAVWLAVSSTASARTTSSPSTSGPGLPRSDRRTAEAQRPGRPAAEITKRPGSWLCGLGKCPGRTLDT
jgi:LysR substrate binding domain